MAAEAGRAVEDLEKKALRRRVREELAALTPEALRRSDRALFARFLALPRTQQARTVFAFLGVPGREPDTAPLLAALLEQGKRVGLPRMLPEGELEVRLYDPAHPLVPASFGILEPGPDCPRLEPSGVDLVLVPALCYDRQGYRLGFGGGYYDRWLARFAGLRVGLCREAVLRDRVPVQPHDSRVHLLLTETQCLSFF